MSSLPDFLTRPDPSWDGWTREQLERLIALRLRWQGPRADDALWAGVPVLREDGAAMIRPLTIDRLETYAGWYTTTPVHPSFSMSPDR